MPLLIKALPFPANLLVVLFECNAYKATGS